MKTVSTYVEVDVDLDDFSVPELRAEIMSRQREAAANSALGDISAIVQELRAAYLARDTLHFDVLLIRLERWHEEPGAPPAPSACVMLFPDKKARAMGQANG